MSKIGTINRVVWKLVSEANIPPNHGNKSVAIPLLVKTHPEAVEAVSG